MKIDPSPFTITRGSTPTDGSLPLGTVPVAWTSSNRPEGSARNAITARLMPKPIRARRHPGVLPRLAANTRSEEHTSELQSRGQLVCRLLLEKQREQQL